MWHPEFSLKRTDTLLAYATWMAKIFKTRDAEANKKQSIELLIKSNASHSCRSCHFIYGECAISWKRSHMQWHAAWNSRCRQVFLRVRKPECKFDFKQTHHWTCLVCVTKASRLLAINVVGKSIIRQQMTERFLTNGSEVISILFFFYITAEKKYGFCITPCEPSHAARLRQMRTRIYIM